MPTKYRKTLISLLSPLIFSLSGLLHAGSPVWTFSPLTATTISVSTADTATVQYQVTNQSRKTHVLEMRGITGISQNTTSGHCANPFTLGYQQSCTLTLTVDGSSLPGSVAGGPVVCQQGNTLQCYQPSRSDALNVTLTTAPSVTTLTTSVSHLALSKTGYTEYGLPGTPTPSSGVPRTITVSNTGSSAASNLSISYPTWPLNTTASSTCGASLAAGSSCTITITPGNTATSNGTNACTTGVAPTPQTISISADNASTVSSTAVILGYGCIYQGGYVYALDDTSAASTSVGGNVATTSNQSNAGIIWSSDGNGGTSAIAIYGISETSTSVSANPSSGAVNDQTACNGSIDGSCDTNNIYVYYQTTATNFPISTSLYATGLCKKTISTYSDWYLPAICEMGYDTFASGSGCGTSSTPTLQNMQSDLVDTLNLWSGGYWSSTESSSLPSNAAWVQDFALANNSFQGINGKGGFLGVRCSRALTS